MSTEKPTSPPESVVGPTVWFTAEFEAEAEAEAKAEGDTDADRVAWRVRDGQLDAAEVTARRALNEVELASDLDVLDGVIRVRGVRYDGVFDGRTGRYVSIKSRTRAADADNVDDSSSEAQPQKPASAFLPLTTTEQVERRDAIKSKLEEKRRALTERSA